MIVYALTVSFVCEHCVEKSPILTACENFGAPPLNNETSTTVAICWVNDPYIEVYIKKISRG